MADEAYRAVFLRVHPTGKMVLSLTTDADGKEPEYAELVGRRARRPGARRQGRRRPTPTASATATASTPSPSGGTPAAISSATAKIRDKGRLLAGMALDAAARDAHVVQRRVGGRRRRRPDAGQDDRGRRAVRARHRRAAARRRGRPRRADGLPRLSVEVALERDLDLVEHLQRAEQRRVGLHAPVGLLDAARGAERAVVADREVERERPVRAARASGRPRRAAAPAALAPRVERNAMSWRLRTSSSIVWWMLALSSSPRACIPPVPSLHAQRGRVGGELGGRGRAVVADRERAPPTRSRAAAGRAPPSPRRRRAACARTSVALLGSEPVRAWLDHVARAYIRSPDPGETPHGR